MLIITKKPKSDPVTIQHTIRGAEISLTIRPYDDDEIEPLREKNTRYEFAKDPDTQQMTRVRIPDLAALGRDVIDHLLISFSGVGESKDKPLPVTRDNKLLLADLAPLKGEKSVHEIVYEKSRELAAVVQAEAESEIKN